MVFYIETLYTHTLSLALTRSVICEHGQRGKKQKKKRRELNGTNQKTNTKVVIVEKEKRREEKKNQQPPKVRSHFGAHEIFSLLCVLQTLENRELIEYEVNNSFKRICNCKATTRCDVYRLLPSANQASRKGETTEAKQQQQKKKKQEKEQSIRSNESIESKSQLKLVWIWILNLIAMLFLSRFLFVSTHHGHFSTIFFALIQENPMRFFNYEIVHSKFSICTHFGVLSRFSLFM